MEFQLAKTQNARCACSNRIQHNERPLVAKMGYDVAYRATSVLFFKSIVHRFFDDKDNKKSLF